MESPPAQDEGEFYRHKERPSSIALINCGCHRNFRCVGAVLLVSPDFLSSTFITGVELPSLLSAAGRGDNKKIFWIHVRRSDVFDNEKFKEIVAYQSLLDDPRKPLADYNDVEKKKAFDKIADQIRAAVLH